MFWACTCNGLKNNWGAGSEKCNSWFGSVGYYCYTDIGACPDGVLSSYDNLEAEYSHMACEGKLFVHF